MDVLRRRMGAWVIGALMIVSCTATGVAPENPQAFTGPMQRGTFYECVIKNVQRGTPLQQAIQACWPDLSQVSGREGLDGAFGLGGVQPAGSAEAPACASGISNPYGADQTPHWKGHNQQDAKLDYWESQADDAHSLWDKWRGSPYGGDVAKQAWALYEVAKAAWAERYKEVYGTSPPTQETTSLPPASGSQPGTDDMTTCEDLAGFFVECQMSGWQRADCASLQAQMNGCDMTIANPGDTAYCTQAIFSEEEVQAAVELACNAAQKKPIPGEDPCTGETTGFTVVTFPTGRGGSLCSDPKAMPDEDDCEVQVGIASFGQRSIADVLEEGRAKAGGPVWILPQTGPDSGPHPPYLLSDIRVDVPEGAPSGD